MVTLPNCLACAKDRGVCAKKASKDTDGFVVGEEEQGRMAEEILLRDLGGDHLGHCPRNRILVIP